MSRLAFTLGEPSGIGPEVSVAAVASPELSAAAHDYFFYGPRARFEAAARALAGAGRDVSGWTAALAQGRVRFEDPGHPLEGTPGRPAAADEPAVLASIRGATAAAMRGDVQAVVTAPIDKRALFHQGFPGWGHTEFLAHLTGAATPTMVLMSRPDAAARPLRVALVTNHVRLKDVPSAFRRDLLESRARVLSAGLAQLGILRPRLAVAGFNPHCGEGGELGTEEIDLVSPAVETLRAEGLDIHGPFSSDTVFVRAIAGEFDAVLALYHDQGMIPVKVYGFGRGVNWTLGIPIIRTSPDHGTAYDIAGSGTADPASMIEATLLAAQLCSR